MIFYIYITSQSLKFEPSVKPFLGVCLGGGNQSAGGFLSPHIVETVVCMPLGGETDTYSPENVDIWVYSWVINTENTFEHTMSV